MIGKVLIHSVVSPIQRYDSKTMQARKDGDVVCFIDHEAAISEARRQERERCIAELKEYKDPDGYMYIRLGILCGIEVLRKGLTQ